jgi:isopentenyl phosphate kinase
MNARLVFLKLGGSLITVKNQPHTPRLDMLERLAREIAEARAQNQDLQILLGHGSGSFGHVPASKYKTRMGVKSAEDWIGFIEVWRQAAELNHLVMLALEKAKLPAIAFPPSAMIIARDGKVATWDQDPIRTALERGLLPVIYGDVVFDTMLGGTILSTEDLFVHLAPRLQPNQLLFAGLQPGVWADFPDNTRLLPEITPTSFSRIEAGLKASAATDVTGGMADKVHQIMSLVEEAPGLRGFIFSGESAGNVRRSLLGEVLGTVIRGL